MSSHKLAFHFLRRKSDGRILCDDGKVRWTTPVENFKQYKRLWAAEKRAGTEYVVISVYDGDSVDCVGIVTDSYGNAAYSGFVTTRCGNRTVCRYL